VSLLHASGNGYGHELPTLSPIIPDLLWTRGLAPWLLIGVHLADIFSLRRDSNEVHL
jgi:hypothetical protein